MPRTAALSTTKTTIEFDPDVREYLLERMQTEGRSVKWIVNNAVRKEMLAAQAMLKQPELFRSEA